MVLTQCSKEFNGHGEDYTKPCVSGRADQKYQIIQRCICVVRTRRETSASDKALWLFLFTAYIFFCVYAFIDMPIQNTLHKLLYIPGT